MSHFPPIFQIVRDQRVCISQIRWYFVVLLGLVQECVDLVRQARQDTGAGCELGTQGSRM